MTAGRFKKNLVFGSLFSAEKEQKGAFLHEMFLNELHKKVLFIAYLKNPVDNWRSWVEKHCATHWPGTCPCLLEIGFFL